MNKQLWSIRIGLFISFFLCGAVHEAGHLLVAKYDGAEVISWSLIPKIIDGMIVLGHVTVNEFSFSSIGMLVIFKLAGLIITLVPAILVYFHYSRQPSINWIFPYVWIFASPGMAGYDFSHIARILGFSSLGWLMQIVGYLFSSYFLLLFIHQIRRGPPRLFE